MASGRVSGHADYDQRKRRAYESTSVSKTCRKGIPMSIEKKPLLGKPRVPLFAWKVILCVGWTQTRDPNK